MKHISGCRLAAFFPILLMLAEVKASDLKPWINEFHYDNTGTDIEEFVEVAVPSDFSELAAVRLTLYNGGDGKSYGSAHLLSSFTAGESIDGITYYSKVINNLQNGAPDGFSLDLNGEVTDFVSYEGAFSASAGPASGLMSRDAGVVEGDATPPGVAVGLTGIGQAPADFGWALADATPGLPNRGQVMAVPEPGPLSILVFFAILACFWPGPKQVRSGLVFAEARGNRQARGPDGWK